MPRMETPKCRPCSRCGAQAEVKYRNAWFCGTCLNPDPTTEYLTRERERMLGQWGTISTDMWFKT